MSVIESAAELAKRRVELSQKPLQELKCFLEPNGDRLIVQQDELKRESKIIYMAEDDRRTRPTTGRVIAAPDHLKDFLGRKVLFAQFSGIALNFKGVPNWRVLDAAEILAFFTDTDVVYEILDTNIT